MSKPIIPYTNTEAPPASPEFCGIKKREINIAKKAKQIELKATKIILANKETLSYIGTGLWYILN